MREKVRRYYRQLQGNEPIGRVEREEWEQSQRNLKNKVPDAVEAFKTAKSAIRSGTRIVEPRKKLFASKTAKAPRSPPKSSPKTAAKTSTNKNKNKNKKITESRAAAAPVSSSTKKNRSLFNVLLNAGRALVRKLTGKTKRNYKA